MSVCVCVYPVECQLEHPASVVIDIVIRLYGHCLARQLSHHLCQWPFFIRAPSMTIGSEHVTHTSSIGSFLQHAFDHFQWRPSGPRVVDMLEVMAMDLARGLSTWRPGVCSSATSRPT